MAQKIGSVLIDIQADTQKLVQGFNRAESAVNKTTKTMKFAVQGLIATFIGLNTLDIAKNFTAQLDVITSANNKLKLVTKTTEEFTTAQKELFRVAQVTSQGYSETVSLYSKLSDSMLTMGKSQSDVIRTIETVNKAIALSGATAQESASAILQLGQAFGSGTLAGDELKAINENAQGLAKAIAKGMGVAVGELKQLGSEGKITSQVLADALAKVAEETDTQYSKMEKTISQSSVNISNAIQRIVGDFDELTGTSSSLAKMFSDLADSISSLSEEDVKEYIELSKTIGTIAFSVGAASIAFSVYNKTIAVAKALSIAYAGSINIVNARLTASILLSQLLSKATKAIPFVAVASAIAIFSSHLLDSSKNAKILDDVLNGTIDTLKGLTKNQLEYRKALLDTEIVKKTAAEWEAKFALNTMRAKTSDIKKKELASNYDAAKEELRLAKEKYIELDELITEFNVKYVKANEATTKSLTPISDTLKNMLDPIQAIKTKYSQFREELEKSGEATKENLAKLKTLEDAELTALDKKISGTKILKDGTEELLRARKEISQIGMTSEELAIQNIIDKTNEWIKAGVSENEVLEAKAKLLEEINEATLIDKMQTELDFLARKIALEDVSLEQQRELEAIRYGQSMLSIQGSDSSLEEKNRLIELETELFEKTLARMELENDTEFAETMQEFQEDALERQLELNDAVNDFAGSFDGIPKSIANVSKAILGLNQISIKTKKDESVFNKKYTKEFIKYKDDEGKTQKLVNEYTKENKQIADANFSAQIQGYANLAGAMASSFEEGSSAAKAFEAVQRSLAIVQLINGIMSQADLVYPLNIVAMATTAAAGFAYLGGGGGGGGGSSAPSVSAEQVASSKLNEAMIELSSQPMLDRLDRQIELLEIIGLEGTASKVKLDSADFQYKTSISSLAEKIIQDTQTYTMVSGSSVSKSEMENYFNTGMTAANQMFGKDLFTNIGDAIKFNADVFRTDALSAFASLYANGQLMALANTQDAYDAGARTEQEVNAYNAAVGATRAGQFQDVAQEYIMSLNDVKDSMIDARDSFEGFYDSITQTTTYADKKIIEAFKAIDRNIGVSSLDSFLVKNIDAINKIEKLFSTTITELFLSQDPALLQQQAEALGMLNEEMKTAFTQADVQVALDYFDAIELVSAAMATSRENIKSFYDSFKTDDELSQSLADSVGVSLAKTYDELAALFVKLESDTLGLTDAELEFLESNIEYISRLNEAQEEANKEALEEQKNHLQDKLKAEQEYYNSIKSSISSITSIVSSLKKAIEKTRGYSETSVTSLAKFYESLEETKALAKGKDYDALKESVSKTIGLSSTLSNASAFSTKEEMIIAQSVAANEFEALDLTMNEELDYLKQIEENTAKTVEALALSISKMGTQISDSISKQPSYSEIIEKIENAVDKQKEEKEKESTASIETVSNAFKDTLGYAPDTKSEGFKYWVNELVNNPNITESNISASIAKGASTSQDVESALNWFSKNNIKEGKNLLDNAYATGLFTDSKANSLLDKYGMPNHDLSSNIHNMWSYSDFQKYLAANIVPFAEGGLVQGGRGGVMGLIGEKSYDELVTPLKNPNDPLGMNALVSEFASMKKELGILVSITEKQATAIIQMKKADERERREA